MNITTLLIIVTVFASVAIIVLTLMQQGKADMGGAFGGGGSQSMFGSRGSANFLSRATSTMVTVFFISAIALAYIYSQRNVGEEIVDPLLIDQASQEVPTLDAEQGGTDTQAIEALEVPSLDTDADSAEAELVEEVPEVPTSN